MGLETIFDNQAVNDYSQLDDIINTLSGYQKSITKLNKKLASTYQKVNKLQSTTINHPQRKTPNLRSQHQTVTGSVGTIRRPTPS